MSEGRLSSRYNGGISLAIGYTTTVSGQSTYVVKEIPSVTSYEPSWDMLTETFEKHDYSTCVIPKGSRFTANITTGIMTLTAMEELRTVLINNTTFTLYCPEFPMSGTAPAVTGGREVYVTSLSQPLEVANYGGKYYRLSFAVAAVALVNGGGA